MQGWVKWWCDLIGVTDPGSIQIATGIMAGGTGLLAAYIAWLLVVFALGLLWAMRD
ncbi:MAG: hypothetical protein R3D51_19485 [Hyphomicrobiaceae bacterium]